MLDRSLRVPKDRMMAPLARWVGDAVHPTVISLGAFIMGLGCCALLYRGSWQGALVLWVLSRVLDGLAGAVARQQGRESDLGGYIDIMLDLVIYALVPIAAAASVSTHTGALWISLSFLLGSFYVNAGSWMYLSAILEKRGRGASRRGEQTTVTFPTGLVEGAETMLFFTLIILLPAQLAALFWVMAVLVGVTAVQRLVWAARWLRDPK
jgi:phosphatidylglycerophosphate synthase